MSVRATILQVSHDRAVLSDICKPVVCRQRQWLPRRLTLRRLKREPLRVEEDKEARRAVLGLPFFSTWNRIHAIRWLTQSWEASSANVTTEVPANAHSYAAGRRALPLKVDTNANASFLPNLSVCCCCLCGWGRFLGVCVNMLSLKLPPFLPSGTGDYEVFTAFMWVVCFYFAFICVIPIARIKLPSVFRERSTAS